MLTTTLDPVTPTLAGETPTDAPATPVVTLTSTEELSPTLTVAVTQIATPSVTISSMPSPTETPNPSPTTPAGYPSGTILISEIAWSGTLASAHDEWIELYNPGGSPVDLQGWVLTDDDDIHIRLTLRIAPYSFALLERTDDTTVSTISADQIYSGSLNNGGEALFLFDPAGGVIDSANKSGGMWPGGESSTRTSMERRGGQDLPGNWATFTGYGGTGHDSNGNPLSGTPRSVNSIHLAPPASLTPDASTPTLTPTPSPDPTAAESPSYPPGTLLINEVAWAGTRASASDEWIELFNPGDTAIDLGGWRLTDGNDLAVRLTGHISSQGYFLLERSDDRSVADIAADQIYSGSLSNGGEALLLLDPLGGIVDSANLLGGPWPAGDHGRHASMERRGGFDTPGNWGTYTGYHGAGLDAAGHSIHGTPRRINSLFFPTPQPTWIPGKVVINEVLIRPHYDWEGRGGVNTGDEYIELLNLGPGKVNLRDWILDDREQSGSKPFRLPGTTLEPGEHVAFFRSRTRIALNDGGDTVRLLSPDGRVLDQISYLRVRAYNLSFGRLPDGSGHLSYGLWPTPGKANLLFTEDRPGLDSSLIWRCAPTSRFRLAITRMAGQPYAVSRLSAQGYRLCWPTE